MPCSAGHPRPDGAAGPGITRRRWLAAGLPWLGPAAARAAMTLEGGARSAELPFERVDNRILLAAEAGAQRGLRMVFDTGGANILDLELARRLALPLHGRFEMPGAGEGRLEAWHTQLEELRIGALRLRGMPFVVLPLSAIRRAIGFERLDGLVGHELLQRFVVQVHPAASTLQLLEGAPPPPDGATELPIGFTGRLPALQARLGGRPLRLAVDSGDRSSLTLFGPFVDEHGLRDALRPSVRSITGHGVGGPLLADVARVCDLELGPLRLPPLLARLPLDRSGVFASRLADGSLGNAVLLRHDHGYDYARRRIWLRPLPGATRPDGVDRSGLWLVQREAPEQGFEVRDVVAGSAAARAGLRVGDRVVEVDGQPAAAVSLPALRERLRDADGAPSLALRLAGEAEPRLLALQPLLPGGC